MFFTWFVLRNQINTAATSSGKKRLASNCCIEAALLLFGSTQRFIISQLTFTDPHKTDELSLILLDCYVWQIPLSGSGGTSGFAGPLVL